MTAPEELPNRRRSDVREFRHNGQAYTLGISCPAPAASPKFSFRRTGPALRRKRLPETRRFWQA